VTSADGEPVLTGVVRCDPVARGPDVAPPWPQRSTRETPSLPFVLPRTCSKGKPRKAARQLLPFVGSGTGAGRGEERVKTFNASATGFVCLVGVAWFVGISPFFRA
jgi:hypothetical protein